jgi:CubicO group peptidase (beta-lactamase class C family)
VRRILAVVLLPSAMLAASDAYPPPRFSDRDRVQKLESALPEIDRIFRGYAEEKKIPGMVWGVVIDARLAHVGTFGVRDRSSQDAVRSSTAFRVASMTKSFTALAVLKLRDDGRLSLEDPVSRWIPQFARMELPTRDSAPLRVRQLMSHSAGFPEDNPWGDQQLSATDAALDEWLRRGIPFSTPPGTRYEYSNYAFGLLGRIVTKASGIPYERYLREQILAKLHMDGTTFEFKDVPAGSRAVGYRLKPDGSYEEEPPLPHGVFGAMGGLLTTADDLAKYVAFHLSAWPARDDPETGPVKRASVREMAHLWTPSNLALRRVDGELRASESGYGYGLRVSSDCRFETIAAHGGGLPGFGSYMAWLPDYGVGLFAMATLTYSGPAEPTSRAWDGWSPQAGAAAHPPAIRDAREHPRLVAALGRRPGEADRRREPVARRAGRGATGRDPEAQTRGRRVCRRGPGAARELAARPVQPEVRRRDRRRLLHPVADAAAHGAAPGLPEAGLGGRAPRRPHRPAGRCRLRPVGRQAADPLAKAGVSP